MGGSFSWCAGGEDIWVAVLAWVGILAGDILVVEYAMSHFCMQLCYSFKSTCDFYSFMQLLIYAFMFAVASKQQVRCSTFIVFYI